MKKLLLIALLSFALFSCKKDDAVDYNISSIFPEVVKNGSEYTLTPNISPNDNETSSIELLLDGKTLEKKISKPFSFKLLFSDMKTGDHKLLLIATLNDGSIVNSQEMTFTFVVSLGDQYQGGIVVKTSDNGVHGAIASKTDLSGGLLGKYKYGAYNGNYQAYNMDDGLENTNKFVGKLDSDYAAIACLNLELNGFDDWYLPANNEMKLCNNYLEKLNIPERSGRIYWSSTGDSSNLQRAYAVPFGVSFGIPCDMAGRYLVKPFRRF